jgi:hypothetical protein
MWFLAETPPDVPSALLNPEEKPGKREFNANSTKGEASKKMEELQQKTGQSKTDNPNTSHPACSRMELMGSAT